MDHSGDPTNPPTCPQIPQNSAGLSTCILEARLPPAKRRVMFALFSCTTSTGIALGIATSAIYDAQSRTAAIVQGVFNALAAGASDR